MLKKEKDNYAVLGGKITLFREIEILNRFDESAIYEVIKVSNGVPVFLEEHIERMRKSAAIKGIRFKECLNDILFDIYRLQEHNKCIDGNVKIIRSQKGSDTFSAAYFMDQKKSLSKNSFDEIHTLSYAGERQNPNVKTLGGSFRDRVMADRQKNGAYEALLTDKDGNITEGSRSNVFFVIQHEIYTPPANEILIGVTRQKVVALCHASGIMVNESTINVKDLSKIEGAFITGTTVDVLPIGSINNLKIKSGDNLMIQGIIRQYHTEIERYIHKKQQKFKALVGQHRINNCGF